MSQLLPWKNSVTYSEYVSVALVIQHVIRMRRILLSCVTCLTGPYFSTLSHTGRGFRKIFVEQKMSFDFLCKFCLIHFSF